MIAREDTEHNQTEPPYVLATMVPPSGANASDVTIFAGTWYDHLSRSEALDRPTQPVCQKPRVVMLTSASAFRSAEIVDVRWPPHESAQLEWLLVSFDHDRERGYPRSAALRVERLQRVQFLLGGGVGCEAGPVWQEGF